MDLVDKVAPTEEQLLRGTGKDKDLTNDVELSYLMSCLYMMCFLTFKKEFFSSRWQVHGLYEKGLFFLRYAMVHKVDIQLNHRMRSLNL